MANLIKVFIRTINVIYFYTACSNKPYGKSFATSKSPRIQSKTLERSISTVSIKFLSSRDFPFSLSRN